MGQISALKFGSIGLGGFVVARRLDASTELGRGIHSRRRLGDRSAQSDPRVVVPTSEALIGLTWRIGGRSYMGERFELSI